MSEELNFSSEEQELAQGLQNHYNSYRKAFQANFHSSEELWQQLGPQLGPLAQSSQPGARQRTSLSGRLFVFNSSTKTETGRKSLNSPRSLSASLIISGLVTLVIAGALVIIALSVRNATSPNNLPGGQPGQIAPSSAESTATPTAASINIGLTPTPTAIDSAATPTAVPGRDNFITATPVGLQATVPPPPTPTPEATVTPPPTVVPGATATPTPASLPEATVLPPTPTAVQATVPPPPGSISDEIATATPFPTIVPGLPGTRTATPVPFEPTVLPPTVVPCPTRDGFTQVGRPPATSTSGALETVVPPTPTAQPPTVTPPWNGTATALPTVVPYITATPVAICP